MADLLITEEIKTFLAENGQRSPEEVALMAAKRPDLPMAFIAQQVKGRAKCARKLPSWAANEDVAFPKSLALEQCSSEAAARYKAGLVGTGKAAADLTGGFGVDGRFLADQFDRFWHFERDEELAAVVRHNYEVLGLAQKVQVRPQDGVAGLRALPERLDLIYLDPARRDERSYRVSALEDCEPNAVAVWEELLWRAERVMLKASPGLDVSLALSQLSSVAEVHVLSLGNECKELLFLAQRDFRGEPRIHCVNIASENRLERFEFSLPEEAALEAVVGIPSTYLYEPNASILKAGAFKSVANRYGVRALNPRTRLYCSAAERVAGFPGRVFAIEGKGALNAKVARRLFPDQRANVISRNSGMPAEELKRKLKLKDGGERFAIGAAVSGIGRQLFACRLVNVE